MDNPKISVIVPVYNVEQYLSRCINSILAQTFTDFELLLIDDGSTDNSGRICDECAKKDNRIRVFHKENGGVSSARNLGLRKAIGEFICFCDSDDQMKDCYLQTLISIEEKTDADMVVGSLSFYVVNTKRRLSFILKEKTYSRDELGLLLCDLREKGSLGVPWNKLFKASIIKKYHVSFDITLDSYEDEVFNLEYLQHANKVATTHIIVYDYILRSSTSLSQRFIELDKHLQIASTIFHLDLNLTKEHVSQEEAKINYMSHYVNCITWLYLRKKNCRKECFATMEAVFHCIPKGYDKYFRTACRRKYIYFKNKYLIDLSIRALIVLKKMLDRI